MTQQKVWVTPAQNDQVSLCFGTLLPVRAKAADEKFTKLREVYQKLRSEHITLLRTNGEVSKKLITAEKAVLDGERTNQVCM